MTAKEDYDRRKTNNQSKIDKAQSERWRPKFRDPIVQFTGVLAVATIGLVVVTGGLVWVALQTDETLRWQQRAWIAVTGIEVAKPVRYGGYLRNGAIFEFAFQLENVGRAPAFVSMHAVVVKHPEISPWRWVDDQKRICEEAHKEIKERGEFDGNYAILPRGKRFYQSDDQFWLEHLNFAAIRRTATDDPKNWGYIPITYGCVMYASTFDRHDIRRTPFYGTISMPERLEKDQRYLRNVYGRINVLGDESAEISANRLVVKDVGIAGIPAD
jgi:hypothetical protein